MDYMLQKYKNSQNYQKIQRFSLKTKRGRPRLGDRTLFVQSFAQEKVRLLQKYLAGLLNFRTFAALFFKSISFYGFNLLQDR